MILMTFHKFIGNQRTHIVNIREILLYLKKLINITNLMYIDDYNNQLYRWSDQLFNVDCDLIVVSVPMLKLLSVVRPDVLTRYGRKIATDLSLPLISGVLDNVIVVEDFITQNIKNQILTYLQSLNPHINIAYRSFCLSISINNIIQQTKFDSELDEMLGERLLLLPFPLIKCKGVITKEQLTQIIESCFPNNYIYKDPASSVWTVMLSSMTVRGLFNIEPEYTKIRIVYTSTSNHIYIGFESPFAIPEGMLPEFVQYLPKSLVSIYNIIISKLGEIQKSNLSIRSHVTIINYLLSLNVYLKNSKILKALVDCGMAEYGYSFDKFNLFSLFGIEIASVIREILNNELIFAEAFNDIYIDYSSVFVNQFNEAHMPQEFISKYGKELVGKYKESSSIDSILFWYSYYGQQYSTIGDIYVTCRGLYDYSLLYANKLPDIIELHRTIDKYISKGYLVPIYYKNSSTFHQDVWLWEFQPTHQKHSRIKRFNLLNCLLYNLCYKLGRFDLPKIFLEIFLVQIFTNPFNHDCLKVLYSDDYPLLLDLSKWYGFYILSIDTSDNNRETYTDILEKYGLLTDSGNYYHVNINDSEHDVMILDDEFDKLLNFYVYIYRNEDLNNTLFKNLYYISLDKDKRESLLNLRLKKWIKCFRQVLNGDNVHNAYVNLLDECDLLISDRKILEYIEKSDLPCELNDYAFVIKKFLNERNDDLDETSIIKQVKLAKYLTGIYQNIFKNNNVVDQDQRYDLGFKDNPALNTLSSFYNERDKFGDSDKSILLFLINKFFTDYFENYGE